MTVPVQTPINSYIYAGSPSFVYSFQLLQATDLLVTVDGVVKTLGVDYTVAGVGVQAGGTIAYLGAITVGQLVSLSRQTTLGRSTDYQTLGDFLAGTINNDFDRLWMALQERVTNDARSVRAPAGETFATLPAASARAGFLLGFDGAGGLALIAAAAQSAAALALSLLGNAGSTLVSFLQAGAGAVLRSVQDKLRDRVSAFDFMTPVQIADVTAGTLTQDVTAALVAMFAVSQDVYLPPGKYKCSSTITVDGKNGLKIRGAGAAAFSAGVLFAKNSTLVFDTAAPGSDGLVISNFAGLDLENFVVSMSRGGAGGGKALRIFGGHNLIARNVVTSCDTGVAGVGLSLGNGTGATSVFTSTIMSCKSIASNGGIAFESNVSNTSLNFIGCYAIHGYWSINTLVYSTFSGCAADGVTGDGYVLSNCGGLTFNACGGESNTLGVFNLAGCAAIVFNSPFGTSNNTSGTANHGDLIHFNSTALGNSEITVISPQSVAPNAATTASIYGTTNTGTVHAINASTAYVIKGFGGDATWLANSLSITGDAENIAFTPVLGAGWANTGGAPAVTGLYNKKGKLVTFTMTITPVTTVTGGAAAQITLPWPVSQATAASVISNTTAFSDAAVTGAKIFLTQATGALAAPLTISGTVLLS